MVLDVECIFNDNNRNSSAAVNYHGFLLKDKIVWLVHILLKQRVVGFPTAGNKLRKHHA